MYRFADNPVSQYSHSVPKSLLCQNCSVSRINTNVSYLYLNDKILHFHIPWMAEQYTTVAKFVVPETNSRKQFYGSSSNLYQLQGVQFRGIQFGNTKTILGRVTILLSCQHFSSCAVNIMIRNWLRDFLSVLQKVSANLFSHSHLISKFQERQSVFNGI